MLEMREDTEAMPVVQATRSSTCQSSQLRLPRLHQPVVMDQELEPQLEVTVVLLVRDPVTGPNNNQVTELSNNLLVVTVEHKNQVTEPRQVPQLEVTEAKGLAQTLVDMVNNQAEAHTEVLAVPSQVVTVVLSNQLPEGTVELKNQVTEPQQVPQLEVMVANNNQLEVMAVKEKTTHQLSL